MDYYLTFTAPSGRPIGSFYICKISPKGPLIRAYYEETGKPSILSWQEMKEHITEAIQNPWVSIVNSRGDSDDHIHLFDRVESFTRNEMKDNFKNLLQYTPSRIVHEPAPGKAWLDSKGYPMLTYELP